MSVTNRDQSCLDLINTYLSQFFAIFLFFKLLPVPIDLNILLMGLNDLILNLVGTLLLVLLLKSTTVFVQLFGVVLDLRDLKLGPVTSLDEGTYNPIV